MAGSGGVVRAASEEVDVASPRKIKAADKALTHLHRLIDLRRVLPGELLPPAASISAEIGVNRMAVLQAFQMLQNDGLVLVRPGRGGARVVGRDERSPAQRLARAVSKQDGILKFHLFRQILESGIARSLAEQGLADDVAESARRLVRSMRRIEDRDEYIAADVEFHELLARATGSVVLAELATVVRWMFLVVLDAVELDRERLLHANEEHAKILAAIVRRSPRAAAEWAHRHAASSMQLVVSELGWGDGRTTNGSNGQGDGHR